jgi:hypothetical protein
MRWWSERGTTRYFFILSGTWAFGALVTLALSLSGVLPKTDWNLSVIWLVVSVVFAVTGLARKRRERLGGRTTRDRG